MSTADHFSKPAVDAAQKAIDLKLVDRYDLIDYHRFVEMMNLQQKEDLAPWGKLISVNKKK
ncbi:hypothetical protein D3C81_2251190 [compost metagenome]